MSAHGEGFTPSGHLARFARLERLALEVGDLVRTELEREPCVADEAWATFHLERDLNAVKTVFARSGRAARQSGKEHRDNHDNDPGSDRSVQPGQTRPAPVSDHHAGL